MLNIVFKTKRHNYMRVQVSFGLLT